MSSYTIKTNCPTDSVSNSRTKKLVRTSEGNLHSVYSRKIGSYFQLCYGKSTDSGQTWNETQLTNEIYTQTAPSIAVDSNNCLHVVWWGKFSGALNNEIRYIKFNGFSWGNIVNLLNINAPQAAPSITIDSNNNLHIVWQGATPPATDIRIKYIKYTSSTNSWGDIVELTPASSYHQYSPIIVVDSNNCLHVVWNGTHIGSTTYTQIRYIKYSGSWGDIVNLTNENYSQSGPVIIVDSNNYLHLTWYGKYASSTTYTQIRYNKYTDSWQTIENLTSENYNQELPSISIENNNNLHIVWDGQYTGFALTQIRHIKYTNSWEEIENLTGDSFEHRFPNLLCSLYPIIGGFNINRPKSGYVFVWVNLTTLTIYISSDLKFEGKSKIRAKSNRFLMGGYW